VGVAGVVCITGDAPALGNHPDAAAVFDLESVGLIAAARGFAQGRFISGDALEPAVDLVPGCVENPADGERSVERLVAKAEAGAEFVQTQMVFDAAEFGHWMELVRSAGLNRRLRVLAGIAPLRRQSIAWRLSRQAPGTAVPDWIIKRLEGASDPEAEGVTVAAETLRAIRSIDGVGGVHLLTFGWAGGARRVLEQAKAES
jgi:methylenetetrahydrofolate reductase (NADPH)